MRAVVDTNILVRAIIKPLGTVGAVLGRLRDRKYTLLSSEPLLEELVDVLARPRIRYGLGSGDVEAVLLLIALRGAVVVPTRRVAVCRDPKDNKVLEAALAGGAGLIVSGDDDLLVLSPFEQIPVVGPARFLALTEEE